MKSCHTISVLMPVFNTEKYVGKAIESILCQEFDDFEFFIIDDSSTDDSLEVIQSYHDPRIRLIVNKTNQGNYLSRNIAMRLAKGKYICVMDSDDIASPGRLLTQFNFMENNKNYVALGSFGFFLYSDDSSVPFLREFDEEECKVLLLRDNVCIHPSLILRRETLVKHMIQYNEKYYYAADFDLLVQLTKVGDVSNIPSFLLYYRIHPEQISSHKYVEQQKYAAQIRLSQLAQFGINPTRQECDLHLKLMSQQPLAHKEITLAESWIDKLLKKNIKLSLYHHGHLMDFLNSTYLVNLD